MTLRERVARELAKQDGWIWEGDEGPLFKEIYEEKAARILAIIDEEREKGKKA